MLVTIAPRSSVSAMNHVFASAGGFGAIRALPHVSFIFSNLGAIVLPVVAVPAADKLFHADGSIANERQAKGLEELGARVAKFAAATR